MTQGHTTMTQIQLGVFKDCLSSGSTTVLGTKTSSVNVSDPALPIPFTLFSFFETYSRTTPTCSHSPSTCQTFCLSRGIQPVSEGNILGMPSPLHFYLKPFQPPGHQTVKQRQAFFTVHSTHLTIMCLAFYFFRSPC